MSTGRCSSWKSIPCCMAVGLALLKVSMKIGSALDATRFHSCATLDEMNEVPAPSSNTTRIFRPLIVVVNVL
ncbi:hypothetical protein DERF_008920 [Dermatophagoides farinae]|uniref:Secreted protein n=1 Tax=Dermatophagoides farinae TaxID=6954 RepID=A0A922I1V3_DERFA|nr:hypothetical protein DERF_008920 [Dermatophagoides farinae]